MKIDYISDLHLDFWIKELNPSVKLKNKILTFCKNLKMTGGDVLIIAGDLGHYFIQNSEFLSIVKEMYENVILVHGNHDFYLISNSLRKKYSFNSFNRINEMKEFCSNHEIHYLDGDTVKIDGVTFGGCGMSWDKTFFEQIKNRECLDSEVFSVFNATLNDPKYIQMNESKTYSPYSTHSPYITKRHFNPFDHFKNEKNKIMNIDDCDVMISHYAPIFPINTPEKFKRSEISTFFYYDGIDDVKRIKPKYWIYGHTHTKSLGELKHGCNFLCNPLGYPKENLLPQIESIIF